MYSEKAHAEVDISVPPEKVFSFLTNPKNIPLVLPGLIENYNIPELPVQVGSKFNFKYQTLGIVQEGEIVVDKVESNSAYDFTSTGGVASKWLQRMATKDGGTHFSLDVEYDPPKSWLDKIKLEVVRKMNQSDAEKYTQNLKTLLEMQS
jgi:hypothetical protein